MKGYQHGVDGRNPRADYASEVPDGDRRGTARRPHHEDGDNHEEEKQNQHMDRGRYWTSGDSWGHKDHGNTAWRDRRDHEDGGWSSRVRTRVMELGAGEGTVDAGMGGGRAETGQGVTESPVGTATVRGIGITGKWVKSLTRLSWIRLRWYIVGIHHNRVPQTRRPIVMELRSTPSSAASLIVRLARHQLSDIARNVRPRD